MQVNVMKRLVREMAAFNEALDDLGLPRQPFYDEPDGVER